MDIGTIATYGAIILSALWTAVQEIRYQIHKVKQNIISEYISGASGTTTTTTTTQK